MIQSGPAKPTNTPSEAKTTTAKPRVPPAVALSPALWATTGFSFATPNEAARRATRPRVADFYSRYGNPTVGAFAEAVADLEGAEAALCSASGMGAISTVVLGLCSSGDHIVTQRQLFSATKQLFEQVCPRFGIEVSFVDATDPQAWARATEVGRTKLVFAESPANPTLELVDLEALGSIEGPVTVVDSTLATPLAQRPIEWGIDLVVHSATKALAGHNDATVGVVAGEKLLVNELWQYAVIHGASASPHDSLNALRGLKTLEVRLARQNDTAADVACALDSHPRIGRVFHPSLDSFPQRSLADRQLQAGCGLVAFEVRGGMEAALDFVERLSIPLLAPSFGGPESLINHPASMTHASLTPQQRAEAGIGDGLLRLSVGLESPTELLNDLLAALA